MQCFLLSLWLIGVVHMKKDAWGYLPGTNTLIPCNYVLLKPGLLN